MAVYRRPGSPYYWYSFNHLRKRIRASTGVTDFKSAKEIYILRRNQFILRKEKGELPPIKIRELFEVYCRDHLKPKGADVKKFAASLSRAADFFGDVWASSITQHDVVRFRNHLKLLPVSGRAHTGSSVNRNLTAIKAAYSRGVQWGLVSHNPVLGIKPFPEADRARTRYLSTDEKQRLLAVCPPALRRIVLFALKTGMRQGEILGLRWEDVDAVSHQIVLKKTKNAKLRFVPIHPDVAEMLSSLPKKSPYVFCREDGARIEGHGWIRFAFEDAVSRAGVRDFKFHDLRHSFASELVMKGADIKTVSELLGHSSLGA